MIGNETTVPAGFTNDPNNKMASKLNGNINTGGNKRVGPSIILKVMTGDTISISVNSWYTGAVQPAATGVTAIANDLLPILTAGIGGENGSKGGSIPTSFSGPLIGTDVATMVSTDSSAYSTARPKAFLNWMVVGEDYVAATGSTNHVGTVQIPVCNAGDTMKSIVGLNRLVCRRNGWIYIYVSNESNQDVYFDNLVINLTHGPVVEQKDYYAFGMQNPALSTQAIKYQYKNNRYTYTGKELQSLEFVDSSCLNEYDFGARFYDPVIARWDQTDPLSEKSRRWSTYNYAMNNPIRFIDPDGMTTGEYGCPDQTTSDAQNNQMENFVDVQDKSGKVTRVITGKSDEDEESYTSVSKGNDGGETLDWTSKYGFKVHQKANERALSRNNGSAGPNGSGVTSLYLPKLKALDDATVWSDADWYQTGNYSYMHAMSNNDPGAHQTPEDAEIQADTYVRAQFALGKALLEKGKLYQTYFEFGKGLHTLQDATSPAHNGFQPWTSHPGPFQILNHIRKEFATPGVNSNLQIVIKPIFRLV